MDGIWKLRSPHCMWPVTTTVEELPLLNYPNVCTNEPINQNNAFCLYHFEEAKKHNVPSNLRDFLRYCGVKIADRKGKSSGNENVQVEIPQEAEDEDSYLDDAGKNTNQQNINVLQYSN